MSALVALLALLAGGSNGASALTNGGFESGDLSGWTSAGDADAVNATFGSGPTEGTYQAMATTLADAGDDTPGLAFVDAVSASELELFLGLAAGSLDALVSGTAVEGTAIRQTISADEGDLLQFDWNFLTDEPSVSLARDTAFLVVDGVLVSLADTGSLRGPSSTFFLEETGFSPQAHLFATSGLHTVAFGVVDDLDAAGASSLLIDDVVVVLPEPAGDAMAAAGAAALALVARRRRRR